MRRFWDKVDKSGGPGACWEWGASRSRDGYGAFRLDGRTQKAHRVAWMLKGHPEPEEIDHLCRNRACVNPAHLRAVEDGFNRLQGQRTRAAYQRSKTHCPQGHPYESENLYIRPNGHRACRACNRERLRRRYLKKKAALQAERSSRPRR